MRFAVLARHGESEWNPAGLLTGWSDPPLSARGRHQARRAGAGLAARHIPIDRVYTSLLGRSIQTASIMMAAAGAPSVPVAADWRLNERHLGRLEGMTKAQVSAAWGNARRKRWRDDDRCPPPSLGPHDPRHPCHDPRYRHVPADRLPGGERGHDTALRVLEVWHERVMPDILAGRTVMVVSHLGPLRILARHLGCRGTGPAAAERWPNAEPLWWRLAARPCCGDPGPPLANPDVAVPWRV